MTHIVMTKKQERSLIKWCALLPGSFVLAAIILLYTPGFTHS